MNLINSVCYYFTKNKFSNIIRHINCFHNINFNNINKTFVVTLMIDNKNYDELNNIAEQFRNRIKKDCNIESIIIPSYNWGGTILGLYNTYKYFYNITDKLSLNNTYIAHFEEDFYAFNNDWFLHSHKLLNSQENYIYIGESNKRASIRGLTGMLKTGQDDGRNTRVFKKYRTQIKLPEVWMDGGYYCSSLDKFYKIDNLIGIFHKGDQNTKWKLAKDGIDLGEVGFPTLVYHEGLKFIPLYRKKFFTHDDCR